MGTRGRVLWVVLAVAVIAIALAVVFAERVLERVIENTVSERTGRELAIGALDVDWSLRPRLRARDVRFANAHWGSNAEMARIPLLDVRIDLRALLSGKVLIYHLALTEPQVWLERSADGAANWEFATGAEEEPEQGSPGLPVIRALSIEQGRVYFREPQHGTDVQVVVAADPQAAAQRALQAEGTGRYRGEPFEISVQGDSLLRLFETDQGYRLQARAAAAATAVTLQGEIYDPRALTTSDLNLRLELEGPDPERLYPLTGLSLPSLPPYRIAGRLVREGARWTLSDFEGRVGDSDLSGDLSLALDGERPNLQAQLHSDLLDLDDLGPLIGAPPQTEPGETASPAQQQEAQSRQGADTVLPRETISLERVHAINAAVHYQAVEVRSGKLPVDSLEVSFRLEDGRMRLDPLHVGVGEGGIQGRLLLDGSSEQVEVKLDAELRRVDLAELLRGLEVADESFGTVAGKANLWLRGNSVAAMLGNADGGLYLLMNGGRLDGLLVELAGLDAGEALIALVGEETNQVPIDCAFLDVQARAGVFNLDTAIVDSTDTLFLAEGAVDLGDETLDVVLAPRPKDPSLFAARSNLRIRGKLASPTVRPGAETLLKGAAAAVLAAAAGPAAALLPLLETGGGERSTICSGLAGSAEEAAGTE